MTPVIRPLSQAAPCSGWRRPKNLACAPANAGTRLATRHCLLYQGRADGPPTADQGCQKLLQLLLVLLLLRLSEPFASKGVCASAKPRDSACHPLYLLYRGRADGPPTTSKGRFGKSARHSAAWGASPSFGATLRRWSPRRLLGGRPFGAHIPKAAQTPLPQLHHCSCDSDSDCRLMRKNTGDGVVEDLGRSCATLAWRGRSRDTHATPDRAHGGERRGRTTASPQYTSTEGTPQIPRPKGEGAGEGRRRDVRPRIVDDPPPGEGR